MDRGEVFQLLRALLQATQVGNLEWEETPDEDTFRAMFQNGMVKVWRISISAARAGLFNQNNTLLTEIEPQGCEEAALLEDVYQAARQSALKPEKVLHGILDELKQKERAKR